MTANPQRRRASTRRGTTAAAMLCVLALVATIVGVLTLRTSEAGEAVEVDSRERIEFPSTPTAAVAVVDEENRLTSVAMATLDPAGAGGSIVTVPINVDTSLGFGLDRSPLSSRPVVADDADSVAAFVADLESVLRLTIPWSVVLTADDVADLVSPLAPLRIDLPGPVTDSLAIGSPEIAPAGRSNVDAEQFGALMTTIDASGTAYDQHPVDVALWTALADAATSTPLPTEVELDEFDRPVSPADGAELLDLLLAGPVGVRDLALDEAGAAVLPNPTLADFVRIDQFDALLVFAQIAPGLVSTPGESLTFQIIAPFSDEQVATELGPDVTTELIVRQLISELVFAEGNVVSVQTTPSPEGAGETTRLDVADADFVDAVQEVAPILFGEVEVREAARIVDGVDVVAVLGTDFLIRRAEILAGIGPTTIADDDAESITDLADNADNADEGDGADDEGGVLESGDGDNASSDTVATDE